MARAIELTKNQLMWLDLINKRIDCDFSEVWKKGEWKEFGEMHGSEYKSNEDMIPSNERKHVALDRIARFLSISDYVDNQGSDAQRFHLYASLYGARIYATSLGLENEIESLLEPYVKWKVKSEVADNLTNDDQFITNLDNYMQGNIEYRNGNFNEAINYYNKAIEIDSNFKEARDNRAKAKNKLASKKNQSITNLKQGNIEYRNGNFNEAINYYNKAIEIDSNFKEARDNRDKSKNKLNYLDTLSYYLDRINSSRTSNWYIFIFSLLIGSILAFIFA